MVEHADTLDEKLFPQNNERARRQKGTDIRVIIGNPPYSVGQGSENDANKNLKYANLDERIRQTYAARSSAGLKRTLYDSYIRAFRYASDRIKDRGVVCFVSNGHFIDAGTADGFRKTLAAEFASIYCFNLRGNQRTSGETSRAEGGKIFGQGSRTPIAITLLVKDSAASAPCRLHYHDIGAYLSREQKLEVIRRFGSVNAVLWEVLTPDPSGDWINLRNDVFESFEPLGEGKNVAAAGMFDTYSLGVVTNRDAWAYNFDRATLQANMSRMIVTFNEHVEHFVGWAEKQEEQRTANAVDRFVDRDASKISWTRALKSDVRKGRAAEFDASHVVPSMYRPFCKQWLYFDRRMNEVVYQIPKIFPTPRHENLVIHASAGDARRAFSVLMTNVVPDLHLHDVGQCFPLYQYEHVAGQSLFSADADQLGYSRRDGISDARLVPTGTGTVATLQKTTSSTTCMAFSIPPSIGPNSPPI